MDVNSTKSCKTTYPNCHGKKIKQFTSTKLSSYYNFNLLISMTHADSKYEEFFRRTEKVLQSCCPVSQFLKSRAAE